MSDQNPPPGDDRRGQRDQAGSQNPYAAPRDGERPPERPAEYDAYRQQESTGGPGLAITALVIGIFSVLLSFTVVGGFLLGLIAVIVGAIASSKAKKGRATGRGMAIGGIVTGIIGILIAAAITAFTIFVFQAADFGSLQECIQQAGDDSTAQAECQQQFQDELEGQLGG